MTGGETSDMYSSISDALPFFYAQLIAQCSIAAELVSSSTERRSTACDRAVHQVLCGIPRRSIFLLSCCHLQRREETHSIITQTHLTDTLFTLLLFYAQLVHRAV